MQQPCRRLLGGLLPFALLVAGSACSSGDKSTTNNKPTFPVKGSFTVDGIPIAGAVVMFHPLDDPGPQATRSYAKTDKDGAFVISTYRLGDGAPPGKYIITIQQDADDEKKVVPQRLGSPKTSDLRVEVKQEANDLPAFRIGRQ